MKCEQIDRWLDAMMDGEISAEDMRRVEEHCETCAECAEKLKLNRQMMGMFAEMAPEMDVPLTAQAAWRSAVKAEAGRAKRRRLYRIAGGVAAALVVAIGVTFALRTPPKNMASDATLKAAAPQPTAELMMEAEEAEYAYEAPMLEAEEAEYADEAPMMAEEYAAAGEAFIEADGAAMMMDVSRKSSAMHEIEMIVEDLDRACEYLNDLVEEYEGTADEQRYEADGAPCANLYIELPAGNADDFIRAAAHYDKSGEDVSQLSFDGDGDVSLLLVLRSE